MRRMWHPFWQWEDIGMWQPSASRAERDEMLARAINFTGDASLYCSWMLRVLDEFPLACQHNLTDMAQNRRAWIGHAAVFLAFGCPEDITRAAWKTLSQQQQDNANAAASHAIEKWEHAQENSAVHQQMEIAGL